MARGAMIIGSTGGWHNPLRVNADTYRLYRAMEEYVAHGAETPVYAYYPDLDNYEDIPTRLRNSYRRLDDD